MFNWHEFLEQKWKAGETQVFLAKRLGISDAMIRALLSGRRPFTWETKRRMARTWIALWGPLLEELRESWNEEEQN